MKLLKNPKRASSYFLVELPLIIWVIIVGITFNVGQVFGPIMLGRVITAINNQETSEYITYRVIIYFITIFLVQTFRYFKRYLVRLFAIKTSKRMRLMMYKKKINESLMEIENTTLGDLLTRCIGDVVLSVEGFRKALTEVFDTGVLMLAYFITLLTYSISLTLLSCIFIPAAMLIAFLLKKVIYKYTKEYRNYASRVSGETFELIDNAINLRNYDSLNSQVIEYDKSLEKLKKLSIKSNMLENCMPPIYKALSSCGIVIIIILGSQKVINQDTFINGIWDVGVFVAYFTLFLNFANKASKAAKLVNAVEKAKISFDRIKPYLENEDTNKKIVNINNNASLAVNNLVFSYGEKIIIGPISFQASRGEIIGVTGEVASGKTTLGVALLGLFNYQGSIIINGKELRDYSKEERSALIAYSGHNPCLISGSIKDNIAFGENKDIREVLRIVDFDKDLENLPEREDTIVGSNGIKLSGGQKQRISLARALIDKRSIIILDDPFSASDQETEAKIFNNIRKYYHDSIIIIIAHRLSIFNKVDKVLMIEKAPLFTTHEKMLELSPKYREIYHH